MCIIGVCGEEKASPSLFVKYVWFFCSNKDIHILGNRTSFWDRFHFLLGAEVTKNLRDNTQWLKQKWSN